MAEGTDHLIKPHTSPWGTLVDRTGDRPGGVESLEQVALTSRELSDLDMLASGALSPLEGFMGPGDYERVVEEMRLESGLAWALPVCLAVDAAPRGDQVALADEAGPAAGRARRGGRIRVRQAAGGRAVLPHDRGRASGRGQAVRAEAALSGRPRHGLRPRRAAVPRARARPGGHAAYVRGARLAAGGRLPDAEPDPPRARVPDQGRARDGRRPADPPARRRDEVRRRAGRDAGRVLPDPRRRLLPGRPRARLGLPGRDALRGPARSDLARDLPQELRLLALHRRPRPRRGRLVLRLLRRAADLRRLPTARARHRADVLRAHVLVLGPAARWPRRRRAHTRPKTTSSSPARRCARCSPPGRAPAGRVLARPEVAAGR